MTSPELTHVTGDDHESDVNAAAVVGFAVALTIALAIALVLLGQLFVVFRVSETHSGATLRNPAASDLRLPSTEPQLQVHPRRELLELRAREDAGLNSYGWVDQPAGIVHVPIEDAMKRIAERGLPTRPAGRPAGAPR
jgi:hypothetical protein